MICVIWWVVGGWVGAYIGILHQVVGVNLVPVLYVSDPRATINTWFALTGSSDNMLNCINVSVLIIMLMQNIQNLVAC